MGKALSFLLAALWVGLTAQAERLPVIPQPQHCVTGRCTVLCRWSEVQRELSSAVEHPEGYTIDVTADGRVTIVARTATGLFYGEQTLLQLATAEGDQLRVPCLHIADAPRFAYRGLHIDVSRHFFPLDFIKRQIDAMARYKLNRLHWHLTDGAGWRMEIKKYPLLTSVAAWRPFASWQAWWDSDRRYCTATDANAYGGYYTQDECREVVRYAAERHITVIPEIEMPGHSEEVMAVYPECSCSGEAYKNNEFCPGKETTFRFLEDVLTEVMDVFPSHYIHIGGDEAEKTAWHTCPDCQRRMTTEHLTDVDQLQSYLIQRIERFVNSRGRSIIGWDEILQGGLSPNATVMSWRGEEGGIRAAQLGHDVVMTPGSHCYFDSYQDAPHTQPKAMGGFLTLEKVYSYNPLPAVLTAEQGRHVLGVQANLWAEHIPTPEHADYMIWPRLLALSEVAWSAPERKEWPQFRQLALRESACLRQLGHHPFDLATEVGERRQAQQPVEHRARGCNVTYNQAFSPYYPAGGPAALVDGHCGGWTHTDGTWQGFVGRDLDVTLDLGRRQKVSEIEITFMQNIQAWIHLPAEVFVDVSADGQHYRQAAVLRPDIDEAENYRLATLRARINGPKTRFVRLRATKPERKGGWLFTDEIILR